MTFIVGPAGSGKSTELTRRIAEASRAGTTVYVGSPSRTSLEALRARLPGDCTPHVASIAELALDVLRAHPDATGLASPLEVIDDVEAAVLFERAAEHVLRMEWAELVEAQVDPEVPGLRAPTRFLESAFRLIRKLRDAQIAPEQFLRSALGGATTFYAKPPNLAHPDILYYTKETYRDSLDVNAAELQRQYRREVDLAKILANLYDSYLDLQVKRGCLTARDAIAEATRAFTERSDLAILWRARFPAAFVDDAQELTLGELTFLQRVYGETLDGVTLAGDPESSLSTFRGARPDRVFAIAGERIDLGEHRRAPLAVEIACNHLTMNANRPPSGVEPALTLFRATTRRAEAQFITEHVVDLLQRGVPHSEIAILFRSVRNVRLYEEALLDRNVRAQKIGDFNVFDEPAALDALALLWNVYDPYRHEWLLRTLGGPALALSDASIYALCSDPPDAQTLLFDLGSDEGEATQRPGRWDPKRDLRLGWNVMRGDQDNTLSELARTRVLVLRERLTRWVRDAADLPVPALARKVWSEGLARLGAADSARAYHQQQTLERLYEHIAQFAATHPAAGLGEYLADVEARMHSDLESWEGPISDGAIRIMSIEAARGREFDHVILPNVRAGAFPRWYAPDAFLYSPSLGMIAKENVGDATAARTAKFTYYMFRTKARETYNREERRAFVYALRRARRSALVTASERATRGTAAPEFLAELQAAHLPGSVDLSDRWRPARTVYAASEMPA